MDNKPAKIEHESNLFREYKVQSIDLIKNFEHNSRTHSEEQINEVVNSIKRYGYTNPILVDENNVIIAGHCRVIAATRCGMTSIPTIIIAGLSEVEKAELVIADNKLSLNSGWDFNILAEQITFIRDNGGDVDATGFKPDEIASFMPDVVPEFLGDEDDVPEVPAEPITKRGDIWLLGRHRLLCGDSTMIDDVEKLMNGEKADMVFTDPPYGMFLNTDYDSMFSNDSTHRKTGDRFEQVKGDNEDFSPEFINTIFASFNYVKEIFIWGADYFSELIPDRKNGSWIVWDKRCDENMDRVTGNTFELCWSRSKHKRMIARIIWSGHHGMQKDDTKTRVHPTQKPTKLIEWFFDNWGKDLKLVIDLFGGSGSTLIACEKTNRKCFMMELAPNYCDVIIARWEKLTGKKAELINNAG